MNIKFTGDFKDLKPMGFKFHKLFANNYKVYEKDKIWIWVARGGYVEVADFYELSGYIVDAIWNDTFPVYEADTDYGEKLSWLNKKKGDKKPCMINRETGKIVERREFTEKYCGDETIDGKTFKNSSDYDYDLWRELSIYKETFDFIRELKDLNIMEIVK